jgi:YtoQ family protein
VNAIRTKTLLEMSDFVVVRFGDKYKQWNAAFDAGIASALNIPLIVMHGADHQHALKEIDASAQAITDSPRQVVQILNYIINGTLPE